MGWFPWTFWGSVHRLEFSVLCCWCWVWLFRKKWGGTNKRIYWESNRIFGGVTWFSSTSETSEYGFIRKLWSQEERATTRKKTQELQHQHHQTTTKKHQPNNNYTTWTGHNWTWTNTQETVIATLTKSDLLPSNSSSRKAGDEGCCIFFSAWFGGRNEPSLVVWSPGDGPHRLIDTMFHMLIRTLLHELVHESCSCQTSPVRSGSINRSTKSGEETNHQTLGFLGHHFKDLFWVRVLNHHSTSIKALRPGEVTMSHPFRPRTTDRNVAEDTSGSVGQTVGCITVLRKSQIILRLPLYQSSTIGPLCLEWVTGIHPMALPIFLVWYMKNLLGK